jgi:tetratricopeptide (TPR) repeat protein
MGGKRVWGVALVLLGLLPGCPAVADDAAHGKCMGAIKTSEEETIAACTELISRGEDLDVAYYDRGIAYVATGRYAEAVSDYDHVIALRPDSADAYRNRCWSYSDLNDQDHALADCDKAISLDPGCGDCWSLRAQVHEDRREFDMALADIDEAIRRQQDELVFYYDLRGRILEALDRRDDAIASYKKAQATDATDTWARDALARLNAI